MKKITILINRNTMIEEPIKYIKHHYYKSKYLYFLNNFLYYMFNIISSGITFLILILTTMIISKTWFDGYPTWYFFALTTISAITAFIAVLFNFFKIKNNIEKYKKINDGLVFVIHEYRENNTELNIMFSNAFKIVNGKEDNE